jgi:CBS domain containing-hemolysin-like protein
MDWISLSAFLLSIIIIGFFFGIEAAFASADKLSIELRKKQGKASGRIWAGFTENQSRFVGIVLVGLNLFIIIYGLLAGKMLLPIWIWIEGNLPQTAADYVKFIRLLVETTVSTAIILTMEFSSRAFFHARHDQFIRSGFIAYVFAFFQAVIASVSGFFISASSWILHYIFNVKLQPKKEAFTLLHPEQIVQQKKHVAEEETDASNKELFENALSIGDVKIRDCLVPRKEVEAIPLNMDMLTVKQRFIDTKLTKLVVFENSIDSIAGYVHQLDMLKKPSHVREILLPIPAVPESMTATDLMNKFSRERKSIAWVVDEFGGTAGIVTMEDLLEELFGEIKDEYDSAEEFVEKQLSENEYIFSGRLELDHIRNKFSLEFPEVNDAETLSGYIIGIHEAIPSQKERIIYDRFEFDILNVSATRIETVKVKLLR